jgi:ubiquinone/menaquinone biosynthesis C-methylase UbiE
MSDAAATPTRASGPYDQIAPHYERLIRPLERWFLARMRETAFRHLPEGARILELGAGTGLNFVFYPLNAIGVATEPSSGMMQIAKSKPRPAQLRLVQSAAEQLPFQNQVFTAAFASLVFCSLVNPAAAFAELRRVVKPGGTIILLEHVRPANLLGPVFDLLNLMTVPLFHDHFNRRTAADAERSGLKLVQVEPSLGGIINLISCRV